MILYDLLVQPALPLLQNEEGAFEGYTQREKEDVQGLESVTLVKASARRIFIDDCMPTNVNSTYSV